MATRCVRALWEPRESSEDDGVDRLVAVLTALADEHVAFSTWFRQGKSRATALSRPVRIDQDSIRASLTRNHTDLGRTVIEDLGWRWSAWNGGTEGFDLSCSCTFGLTSPRLKNNFLLDLPADLHGSIDAQDRLMGMVQAVWQPDDLSIWAAPDGVVRRLGEPTST